MDIAREEGDAETVALLEKYESDAKAAESAASVQEAEEAATAVQEAEAATALQENGVQEPADTAEQAPGVQEAHSPKRALAALGAAALILAVAAALFLAAKRRGNRK